MEKHNTTGTVTKDLAEKDRQAFVRHCEKMYFAEYEKAMIRRADMFQQDVEERHKTLFYILEHIYSRFSGEIKTNIRLWSQMTHLKVTIRHYQKSLIGEISSIQKQYDPILGKFVDNHNYQNDRYKLFANYSIKYQELRMGVCKLLYGLNALLTIDNQITIDKK